MTVGQHLSSPSLLAAAAVLKEQHPISRAETEQQQFSTTNKRQHLTHRRRSSLIQHAWQSVIQHIHSPGGARSVYKGIASNIEWIHLSACLFLIHCFICQQIPVQMTPSPTWKKTKPLLDAPEEKLPLVTVRHPPERFQLELHCFHQQRPIISLKEKQNNKAFFHLTSLCLYPVASVKGWDNLDSKRTVSS